MIHFTYDILFIYDIWHILNTIITRKFRCVNSRCSLYKYHNTKITITVNEKNKYFRNYLRNMLQKIYVHINFDPQ